jgi:hypothetical protein
MIELTLLTNYGRPLTKKISLAPDGKVVKSPVGAMAQGWAERVRVANGNELGALIENLAPEQAIALGFLRTDLPDKVIVTTKAKLMNGAARPDVIARTGSNIVYQGPALALLDYDTKGMPAAVAAEIERRGGFPGVLLTLFQALCHAVMLIRRSTSAGLFNHDIGDLPESDGFHIYILVEDGADSARFLRTLHERCWLAGFGWYTVSKSGVLLERSIIDVSVGRPERLVFESAPTLVPPLQQDTERRRPHVFDGNPLDTVATYPELTIVERERLNSLKAAERNRLASEARKVREAYVERETKELVERNPGMSVSAARKSVERRCEGVLRPDVVLPFDDDDLAGCTVGDVLADPERFEGETLADPLEGVEYGTCKAKILRCPDGTPWINSFAHGGIRYTLKHDAASVRAAMEKAAMDDVVATFTRLVPGADLDPVEEEGLRQLTKQLSGVGLRVIDKALKAAKQQQAEQNAAATRARQAAERHDPRPELPAPFPDEPWLPQMEVLNEIIGKVIAATPPSRDIDGDAMRVRKLPVPNMHAFSQSEVNIGDDE